MSDLNRTEMSMKKKTHFPGQIRGVSEVVQLQRHKERAQSKQYREDEYVGFEKTSKPLKGCAPQNKYAHNLPVGFLPRLDILLLRYLDSL